MSDARQVVEELINVRDVKRFDLQLTFLHVRDLGVLIAVAVLLCLIVRPSM